MRGRKSPAPLWPYLCYPCGKKRACKPLREKGTNKLYEIYGQLFCVDLLGQINDLRLQHGISRTTSELRSIEQLLERHCAPFVDMHRSILPIFFRLQLAIYTSFSPPLRSLNQTVANKVSKYLYYFKTLCRWTLNAHWITDIRRLVLWSKNKFLYRGKIMSIWHLDDFLGHFLYQD